MRTITTTKTVYTFDELSETAKEKAIEKCHSINVDFEWWENVYEDAENIGLKISGFDIGWGGYVKGNFLLSACEVSQSILNNHGETTETYKTAEDFLGTWQPVFDDYMDESSENYESREYEDKMLDIEAEFLRSLCEDYRIMLQREYEYLTSAEAIVETFKANEYEFDEEGNIQ